MVASYDIVTGFSIGFTLSTALRGENPQGEPCDVGSPPRRSCWALA